MASSEEYFHTRRLFGQLPPQTTMTPHARAAQIQGAINAPHPLGIKAPGESFVSRLGQIRSLSQHDASLSLDGGVHAGAMDLITRRGVLDPIGHSVAAAGHQARRRAIIGDVARGAEAIAESRGADIVEGSLQPEPIHTVHDVHIPGRPHQEWDDLLDQGDGHEERLSLLNQRYDEGRLPDRGASNPFFDEEPTPRSNPLTENVVAPKTPRRSRKAPMAGQQTLSF